MAEGRVQLAKPDSAAKKLAQSWGSLGLLIAISLLVVGGVGWWLLCNRPLSHPRVVVVAAQRLQPNTFLARQHLKLALRLFEPATLESEAKPLSDLALVEDRFLRGPKQPGDTFQLRDLADQPGLWPGESDHSLVVVTLAADSPYASLLRVGDRVELRAPAKKGAKPELPVVTRVLATRKVTHGDDERIELFLSATTEAIGVVVERLQAAGTAIVVQPQPE